MTENKIEVKSVNELLGMRFFIPSYQRGYRWTEQQVKDLLNDVNEFKPQELPDSKEKTWYCLQPLVVKRMSETDSRLTDNEKNDWYEIIDGQQRLTTIYIILKIMAKDVVFPTIQYQTRPESSKFLDEINYKNSDPKIENIDFHFMLLAKKAIDSWKKEKNIDNTKWEDLHDKLKNSCKVIWYETQDNAYEVFKRLNSGKISLSNAELVKALLLKDNNFIGMNADASRLKQLEMAGEWDRMEQTLHDNSFWYFINPEPEDSRFSCTRIDFLLEMILRCKIRIVKDKKYTIIHNEKKYVCVGLSDSRIQPPFDCKIEKDSIVSLSGEGTYGVEILVTKDRKANIDFKRLLNQNDYFIFSSYLNRINEFGWENTWREIQRFFRIMKAWYDNRQLYHYIGYLMNLKGGDKMAMLQDLLCYAGNPKDVFLSFLIERCQKSIGIGEIQKETEITEVNFANWEYGKNNNSIHNVLLLFNLATAQNQTSEVSRYPFDKHFEAAKRKWSLEHIHAQNEAKAKWDEKQFKDIKGYLEKITVDGIDNLRQFLKDKSTSEDIDDDTYKAIISAFMGKSVTKATINGKDTFISDFEKDDHLTNMALLQGDKNAAFNNKLYPEKRSKLAEYENAEKESLFVPICTRNVFFKHYSPDSTNPLIWDEQAGREYITALTKVIAAYLQLDAILPKKNEEFKYGVKMKGVQK